MFNLISQQPDIDRIYSYAKDPYAEKHQFLINKQEGTGLKHFNDSKAFIEYANDMDGIYKNIEEYNPNKNRKILIEYKIRNPIVTELFIKGKKLNISLVLITQSHFAATKKY